MTTTYTAVAKNLLELIKENKLGFGEKLPSERSLSAQFKVSRSSVREGIRTLVNKGILCSRRGDGTYVAMPEQVHLNESLTKTLKNSTSSKDIFQLRYIMEPEIAALAAINATPEQIDRLKILAFDITHTALNGADVTVKDLEFHLAIAKCTGNILLESLIDSLGEILSLSRTEDEQRKDRVQAAAAAHFKIVEAIVERDPDRAREAMKEHIQFVEVKVREEKDKTRIN